MLCVVSVSRLRCDARHSWCVCGKRLGGVVVPGGGGFRGSDDGAHTGRGSHLPLYRVRGSGRSGDEGQDAGTDI